MIAPPERMPERDAAILGMLPHVAFDGWSKRALRAGVLDAGMPSGEAEILFPLGAVDMIETFCDLADRRMEEAAAGLPQTRLTARVRAIIALRLQQNRPYKEAIRRGLLPIINQMSAAGIVTLPGIMTGQILAGLDPLEAVKYQILLMFLLSGGSGLSALAASYLAAWRLTDERQRLRLDRLR